MPLLREEIRDHVRLLEERYRAQGMSVRDAARAARRQFGNVTALKERQRVQRGILAPGEWWRDVRFGLRMLAKRPASNAAVVVALALRDRHEHGGVHVCEWNSSAAAARSEPNRKNGRAVAEEPEAERAAGVPLPKCFRLRRLGPSADDELLTCHDLDLEPVARSARPVRRREPFCDDAFEPRRRAFLNALTPSPVTCVEKTTTAAGVAGFFSKAICGRSSGS